MRRIAALLVSIVLTATVVAGCASPVDRKPLDSPSPRPSAAAPAPEPVPTESAEVPAPMEPQTAVPVSAVTDVQRMPWTAGWLEPLDFEHTFEVYDPDPRRGYPADDSGAMRLLLAHATSDGSSYGVGPGNAWLAWGKGDHVEVFGKTYVVAERWDAPKSDYATQPPLADASWRDYRGAVSLVTCRPISVWQSATHNVWTVLRPIGDS